MIAVIFFGLLVGAGLVLLLARYGRPILPSDGAQGERATPPRISSRTLRSLVVDLLAALDLTVVEEEARAGEALRLVATRQAPFQEGRYLVYLAPAPPRDQVPQATIIELAEELKTLHGAVGLLITPYAIERAGLAGLDLAELELIDGPRLRQLVAQYLPARLAELDGYRGLAASTTATPSLETLRI